MTNSESQEKLIIENQRTWDKVADVFRNASSLPSWGPFGVGEDLDLIGDIEGKTFLEIGCGGGRSIKFLTQRGAANVFGLDFSEVQLKEAAAVNQNEIDQGRVHLVQTPMENRLKLPPVDCVFSIYALGWSVDPKTTLANIHSYLKPGGKLVWSWDHSFFTDVDYKNDTFQVVHSYHEETQHSFRDWKKEGTVANLTYRKTATWFQLLIEAGFEISGYFEPEPRNLSRGFDDPKQYYSIQKARLVPATFIFVCRKK